MPKIIRISQITNGVQQNAVIPNYAIRSEWINGTTVNIYMHRQIMKFPKGKSIDHRNMNEDGMSLDWSHQTKCIADVAQAIREGHRRILMVMPTGSGKSHTIARMLKFHAENGGHVLVAAHRDELVAQMYATVSKIYEGAGILSAKIENPNLNSPVQVASIQTLLARDLRPYATLIVIDEAHHLAMGNSWSALLDVYSKSLIIGATATPARSDDRPLTGFTKLVIGATVAELTEKGILVPCPVIRPNKVLRSDQIAQSPVDEYLKWCDGKQAIVFAANSQAAEKYEMEFDAKGIPAAFVSYKRDRTDAMAQFKAGALRVLISISILTEGYDHAPTYACILARSVGSLSLLLQMAGRVLRSAPGKTSALLIDLAGSTWVLGTPDQEVTYSLNGSKGITRKAASLPFRFCQICSEVITSSDLLDCPGCGMPLPKPRPPTVTLDPTVKYAAARRRPDDAKRQHYRNLLDESLRMGYYLSARGGKAFHTYKAIYAEEPPTEWYRDWDNEE
jgi:DNA repair protein RadD